MKIRLILSFWGVSVFLLTFSLTLIFLISLEKTFVNIRFTNGSIGEYVSPIHLQKGDSVLVYGPEYVKKIIPKKREYFMKSTIPAQFFPILKDTVLVFSYGPMDSIFQEVKRGVVVGVFQKNIFQ